jgi:hypothetical protein
MRMSIYDQIYAACQPYWQVRANDLHIPVVYGFAQQLLAAHPQADVTIVLPAALMHDNGYANVPEELLFQGLADAPTGFKPDITRLHEIEGVKIARAILAAVQYDAAKTELICTIIDGHDSRLKALSLEDALVKDADKLWRFTSIGVQTSSPWMPMEPVAFLDYCVTRIERWFFTDIAKQMAHQLAAETRAKYA